MIRAKQKKMSSNNMFRCLCSWWFIGFGLSKGPCFLRVRTVQDRKCLCPLVRLRAAGFWHYPENFLFKKSVSAETVRTWSYLTDKTVLKYFKKLVSSSQFWFQKPINMQSDVYYKKWKPRLQNEHLPVNSLFLIFILTDRPTLFRFISETNVNRWLTNT